MKLKHLPNALGLLRIALMVPLLILTFVAPFSLAFIIIFITAGVTDIIDGPLARRIKGARSEFGATIDSVADMIMVLVSFIFIIPRMDIDMWLKIAFWAALAYKLFSGVLGNIKHKEMVWLHTYGNKFLAITLFSLPILYYFVPYAAEQCWFIVYATIVMASIVIITTEEILINMMLTKPSRDIKSVFGVKAANEKTAAEEKTTKSAE